MRIFPPILVAIIALACAGDAVAVTPRVMRMVPIAEKIYPGAERRCGNIQIRRVPDLDTGARALLDECIIEIDEEALHESRRHICALIVHEYGHHDREAAQHDGRYRSHSDPAMFDHNENPNSIMYGRDFAIGAVPACNRFKRLEHKIEDLREYAASLRDIQRETRSYKYKRRIKQRRAKIRQRISAIRKELGP